MNINDIVALVTEEVYKNLAVEDNTNDACIVTPEPVQCNDVGFVSSEFAKYIEYTVLRPDATRTRVIDACNAAKKNGFGNICVTPYFVAEVSEILRTCNVGVCAPVGYPNGAASTAAKICEIKECIANGATELDVQLNLAAIKSGDWGEASRELKRMLDAAGFGVKFKAIYEQGMLSCEEKAKTLEIIRDSGAPYVMISNALSDEVVSADDVKYVKSIVGNSVKIKVDSGIKIVSKVKELLDAGADRVACSVCSNIAAG